MTSTEFERASKLVELLTASAVGKSASNGDFNKLRYELFSNNKITKLLPDWLKTHRNLDSFKGFIRPQFETNDEIMNFIAEQMSPALNYLEFGHAVEMENTKDVINHYTMVGKPSVISKNVKGKKNVFIVHGHDNEAKQEVSRHIETLGLKAIILHEQASAGMTIIEKIEHHSNDVDFAIVLYTACDLGRGINEKVNARNRARQNVVFEHGYLMAKLGRKNVCALVKGDIETPNDISGVVYVDLDRNGAWKTDINKELENHGYQLKT
ncbi:MAG: nucleotide-binding protein [Saprospiraceae bacterium]|nr:nucleotide-binding protein [Saprospiraceae bacterium]